MFQNSSRRLAPPFFYKLRLLIGREGGCEDSLRHYEEMLGTPTQVRPESINTIIDDHVAPPPPLRQRENFRKIKSQTLKVLSSEMDPAEIRPIR